MNTTIHRSSSDLRIELCKKLGWTGIKSFDEIEDYVGIPPHWYYPVKLPKLDDNFLRKCRSLLITLKQQCEFVNMLNDDYSILNAEDCWDVLQKPAIEQAEAILYILEKEAKCLTD